MSSFAEPLSTVASDACQNTGLLLADCSWVFSNNISYIGFHAIQVRADQLTCSLLKKKNPTAIRDLTLEIAHTFHQVLNHELSHSNFYKEFHQRRLLFTGLFHWSRPLCNVPHICHSSLDSAFRSSNYPQYQPANIPLAFLFQLQYNKSAIGVLFETFWTVMNVYNHACQRKAFQKLNYQHTVSFFLSWSDISCIMREK